MKRSKSEVRRLKAEVRSFLAAGLTDREVAGELGITLGDLRSLKSQLLSDELEEIRNDTPEEVWAKYRMRMDGCITDLDNIIQIVAANPVGIRGGLNASVGAVKAKAQILDNVLKKGQELGVLHREPDKKLIIGGISVMSVEVAELHKLVESRRGEIKEMVTTYAPKALIDYAEEPDGDIYADPEVAKIPVRRKV